MKQMICPACKKEVSLPENTQGGFCPHCGAALQPPAQQAKDAMQAGDFASAARYLQQALGENPKDYEANFLQGMILAQTTDLLRREFGEFCRYMEGAFAALEGQEEAIQVEKTLEYADQLCDYAQAERAKSDLSAPGEDELLAWRGQICRIAALYYAAFQGFTPAFLKNHPEYMQRKAELAERVFALCGETTEPIWYVQEVARGRDQIALEEPFGLTPKNCDVMRRSCMDYLKASVPELADRLWEAPLQRWLQKAQELFNQKRRQYRRMQRGMGIIAAVALAIVACFAADSYLEGLLIMLPPMVIFFALATLPNYFFHVAPYRKLLRKIEKLVEQEMAKK